MPIQYDYRANPLVTGITAMAAGRADKKAQRAQIANEQAARTQQQMFQAQQQARQQLGQLAMQGLEHEQRLEIGRLAEASALERMDLQAQNALNLQTLRTHGIPYEGIAQIAAQEGISTPEWFARDSQRRGQQAMQFEMAKNNLEYAIPPGNQAQIAELEQQRHSVQQGMSEGSIRPQDAEPKLARIKQRLESLSQPEIVKRAPRPQTIQQAHQAGEFGVIPQLGIMGSRKADGSWNISQYNQDKGGAADGFEARRQAVPQEDPQYDQKIGEINRQEIESRRIIHPDGSRETLQPDGKITYEPSPQMKLMELRAKHITDAVQRASDTYLMQHEDATVVPENVMRRIKDQAKADAQELYQLPRQLPPQFRGATIPQHDKPLLPGGAPGDDSQSMGNGESAEPITIGPTDFKKQFEKAQVLRTSDKDNAVPGVYYIVFENKQPVLVRYMGEGKMRRVVPAEEDPGLGKVDPVAQMIMGGMWPELQESQ